MTIDQTGSAVERFEDLLALDAAEMGEGAEAVVPPVPEADAGEAGEKSIETDATDAPVDENAGAERDDAVEQPEDPEDPEDEDAIEVEIDGQTRRLTAAEVRDGILMRADYTRKTQDLADQRRAFEAEREQVDSYLRQQLEMLGRLEEPEPDWDRLYDENPSGAPKIERDWRARQAERRQALEHRAEHQERTRQQHLAQQAALLPELIPEWSDPELARSEQAELRNALIDDGFSPEDVALVADARLVRWLRAAHRQFRAEKAAAGLVRKKVAGKPRVQRPGSAAERPGPAAISAARRDAARQSQSKDAWTKVFEDFV